MMNRKLIGILVFLMASTAFLASATAQTTMQREEMRQRGELDEEDEQEQADESREEERSTTRDNRQRQQEEEEDRPLFAPEDYVHSESYFVHVPGLRFDAGATFVDGGDSLQSYGIGLGYMYAWEYELMIVRSASKLRLGAGPDLMFITSEWERLDGVSGYLTARASGIGPRGGLTLEGGAGGAVGRGGLRPLLKAGAFFASDYADIGYYFQTPIGSRPFWVTTHHIGFRLHLPMFHH